MAAFSGTASNGSCARRIAILWNSCDTCARGLLCCWAVRELGVPMSSLARKLKISIPSVTDSVARGRRIAEEKQLDLLET